MAIEDRITELEGIVQQLHGLHGHKWFYDGYGAGLRGRKRCACGAEEYETDEHVYATLPRKWELESQW